VEHVLVIGMEEALRDRAKGDDTLTNLLQIE